MSNLAKIDIKIELQIKKDFFSEHDNIDSSTFMSSLCDLSVQQNSFDESKHKKNDDITKSSSKCVQIRTYEMELDYDEISST